LLRSENFFKGRSHKLLGLWLRPENNKIKRGEYPWKEIAQLIETISQYCRKK
jgi:hypothetical protein